MKSKKLKWKLTWKSECLSIVLFICRF